jgi:coenzyme F420-reducing hydrogenase beta subunit
MMRVDDEGFSYPQINSKTCVDCGLCVRICPSNQEKVVPKNIAEPDFWAGYHLNYEVLMNSSSGGAFSALAEIVLNNNGVVFGVAMDALKMKLCHISASSMDELEPMRLSKYFQSDINDTYCMVKEKLLLEKNVLFSGTACQIAGLLAYLGNTSKDKLITLDILCHGVASKKIVLAYLASQEKKSKNRVKDFKFRIKDGPHGWQGGEGHRMKISFNGGSEFIAERPYDTYFIGFNNNLFLRESCYHCKYCGEKRNSDFTVADYWGCSLEDFSNEQMRKGISLILANSNKAKAMIPELSTRMRLVPANKEEAISHNRALTAPQKRPELRNTFFTMVDKYGYDGTIERIFRKRFIKYRVKNCIKKLLPQKLVTKILKNA